MAWPATPLDVEVDLLINGAWVNTVTTGGGVRHSGAIEISYGRSDWSQQVDHGTAEFTLDNRDGRWSPDLTTGPYYGQYRRNIQCRIGIGRGEVHLRPNGSSSKDVASTPDISGGGGSGTPTAPAYSSVTQLTETTATTTHDVALPAIVNTTDRLLLIICAGHESLTPKDQGGGVTDLDDWTLVDSDNLYTPWHRWLVYEIEASSSALATALAGSTVQFSTTIDVKSSAQVIRTTGARSGIQGVAWDYAGPSASAFDAAPNPPNLAVGWGSEPVRWYAATVYGTGGDDVSAYPSSYTSIADTGAATLLQIGTAHRTTTAASENPGAFTLAGSENWQAFTFVYRGAEVPGTDGVLDISGDIDMRIELELEQDLVDITKGGSRARLAHKSSGADGWEWDLYCANGVVVSSFVWRDSGGVTKAVTTEQTGAALPLDWQHEHRSLRVTLDVNNGASGHTVTWYTATNTLADTWVQLGSPVVTAGTTSIKTNDAPLRVGGNPGDGAHIPLPGKIYAFQLRNGIGGTVVANPAFNAQTAGATGFTDSATRVWTIGAGGRITNMLWRFHGELSSLPVRWNIEGADITAPVEAAGLFRRLRQGNRILESAIRRAILRGGLTGLVQYWPMEEEADGPLAQFGPAVGSAALIISGEAPDTASVDRFSASAALPTLGTASLTADVDDYTATGAWQVRWLQYIPATFTGDGLHFMRVETTDMVWEVEYRDDSGGQLNIHAYRGLTEVYTSGYIAFNATGQAWRMTLSVNQNGGSVDVKLLGQAQSGVAGGITDVAIVAGSAGTVNRIRINKDANVGSWAFGHVTLQSAVTASTELATELNAYNGERAGARIQRLLLEEGIPFRIEGDPAGTESMGPQRAGTLMNLLQECADTDLGILHESRETVAVGYRTRASMLDQPVLIDLDYAAGNLAGSPELDRDDQDFANDVTVKNRAGNIARAVLDDGSHLSVSEPPVGAGRYDRSYSVNALDSRLPELAATRLALTTVDEPRVSRLPLGLHHASMVADVPLTSSIFDSSLGDRVVVSNNLSVALGTADIDQLVQGTRERITSFTHHVDLLTTPSSPWVGDGGVTPPDEGHTVDFRDSAEIATPGTPPHVLAALGYAGATPITRAQLDGILDDWVAGTGGTTRNVTSAATWTTAINAALPGDLIRCTSSFDPGGALTVRGNKYGIPGSNLTASPAGGTAGLPIIVTCADGVVIDDNNQTSNVPVLDLLNCSHVWAVGFNVREGQFGIRGINWGGSSGFPAYRAYNTISDCGHSGLIAQGWGALITGAGGTPPAGADGTEGYSEWFVDEENTIAGTGKAAGATAFGESMYYGKGSDPGWLSYCRDFWVRGNDCSDFASDALDLKPGCLRWKVTDNDFHFGATHFGAMIQCLYVGSGYSARPSWAVNPEGRIEGNRFWDHSITKVQANSSPYVIQASLAGVTIANNIAWAIADANTAGTPSGTGIAVHLRSERTRAESRVGTEKWVIVNNLWWVGSGLTNGGGGVGGGFEGAFDTAWIDARNNLGFTTTTNVQFTATTAEFIDSAAIPAIGSNSADAQWETYGAGSAFDLALTSGLIGDGVSIADIDTLIDADISQRVFIAAVNPGPFQPHPANY